MRGVILVFSVAVVFVLAVFAKSIFATVSDHDEAGASVRCIAGDRLCVGAAVTPATFARLTGRTLGKPTGVTCGDQAQGTSTLRMSIGDLTAGRCRQPAYVVTYSNGRRVKTVWVAQGRIVKLANFPARLTDL